MSALAACGTGPHAPGTLPGPDPATARRAGRIAAWAGAACFAWHLAWLASSLLSGGAPAPTTVLMVAVSVACLTCTGELWRGPDRTTWRRVAALGLLGLTLHLAAHGGHHAHAHRPPGHTRPGVVVAASGHAGHGAASPAPHAADVPAGPGHAWAVTPVVLQLALAIGALCRPSRRRGPGSTRLPGPLLDVRAPAPDGA